MGLDATVFCDCYEHGDLTRPPPYGELVYVDELGAARLRSEALLEFQNEFDDC
jgi:hypothetical protein